MQTVYLTMILVKLEKFFEFFQERNVISKIQNYDETVLPSLPNFDNDDPNDDENDIDIFSLTDNIERMKCHKENSLYAMSRSEL